MVFYWSIPRGHNNGLHPPDTFNPRYEQMWMIFPFIVWVLIASSIKLCRVGHTMSKITLTLWLLEYVWQWDWASAGVAVYTLEAQSKESILISSNTFKNLTGWSRYKSTFKPYIIYCDLTLLNHAQKLLRRKGKNT